MTNGIMTNGIVKTNNGFAVKDFNECKILFHIGKQTAPSYEKAVEICQGKYYPMSFYKYLMKVSELKKSGKLTKEPDADIWENLIYADDYRGIWDGTNQQYRNVTEMDKGAATEEEIDYVDALASTYESLMAMVTE